MNQVVLSDISAELEILNAVVVTHPIFVVRHFLWCKVTSDMLLNNQPVFSDIPTLVGVGVSGQLHQHVTVTVAALLANFQVGPATSRGGGLHDRSTMR